MLNPNVMYTVTGRYMDGQRIVGYHLQGEDGSQAQESKDRIILLIQQGVISNMRTQTGADGEIIVRGKGVNLNNLPVFDQGKQQFRNNNASQQVVLNTVPVAKSPVENANQMGQYMIQKRIMQRNRCIGYEVANYSGAVKRMSRENVIKLAMQKLVSNAVAQKYNREGKDVPEIILRGFNCDLNKLPILIVDSTGKIIDPTQQATKLTVRGAYMKRSGLIKDYLHNKNIPFKAGDFIICQPSGDIIIKSKSEIEGIYAVDKESNTAVCDDYLSGIHNYSIEIFGGKPVQLTSDIVKKWAVFKPKAVA